MYLPPRASALRAAALASAAASGEQGAGSSDQDAEPSEQGADLNPLELLHRWQAEQAARCEEVHMHAHPTYYSLLTTSYCLLDTSY